MKKLITITSAILLLSCTKETSCYRCTVYMHNSTPLVEDKERSFNHCGKLTDDLFLKYDLEGNLVPVICQYRFSE